jgi:hypothetical protein
MKCFTVGFRMKIQVSASEISGIHLIVADF